MSHTKKTQMITTGKYPALRLRRGRSNEWIRRLLKENTLSTNDLILPLFIISGKNKKIPIKSMPGVYRYSIDKLISKVSQAVSLKIPMIALFPYVDKNLKNKLGTEALNKNNLVCKATKKIKQKFKDKIGIMCDVALDPYTNHGHDGLVKSKIVLNDETNKVLIKQALIQAKSGCDVIAPSDMMDGRVYLIRKALDKKNFKGVKILSYAVKYASSFYGPFRDAVGTKKLLRGDKKTYQMDYNNSNEALREVALDIKEGADMVMVKPGMPYLDIIKNIKDNFKIPVLAYQVSGEYSLIADAIKKGTIDKEAIIESLTSFKRSGASAIVTYFADRVAKDL